MDRSKRVRASRRTAFTKALNTFYDKSSAAQSTYVEVSAAFHLLEEKMTELSDVSREVLDLCFSMEGITDEEIQKETDDIDEYRRKFLEAEAMMRERNEARAALSVSGSVNTVRDNRLEARKSYNLPKIEIAKFSGQVREWLQFWSLFQKIHESEALDNADKFQYLIQAMVPGSRAADLVNSYPPTKENYDKVIASLKARFGREDLLIEVYVRELLQLVLQNSLGVARDFQLSTLYDKIESHLRALDTLGVTTDKCAAMLYPLVESCLPEELLRVWQRSCTFTKTAVEGNASRNSKDRLSQLIAFINDEVQNEVRISMAAEKFGLKTSANNQIKPKVKNQVAAKDIPSATGLLATRTEYPCLFCESKEHVSENCEKGRMLSNQERLEFVKGKRACFKCLRIGHIGKTCRVRVKCNSCQRHHATIMCSGEAPPPTKNTAVSSVNTGEIIEECSLANVDVKPVVFLKTLKVKLIGEQGEMIVRAIIDYGSQHSYITKNMADHLGYKAIGKQRMNHLLFGGQRVNAVEHKRYKIRMRSLDNDYMCNFEVMDQDTICEDVPSVSAGVWCDELKALNISLSDLSSAERTVAVLIGADIAGKLNTGRVQQLKCGLTAEETRLGWTLVGKIPGRELEESSAVSAIAMYVRDCDVQGLWELDVLGIGDPIAHKTKQERASEIKEEFLKSVTINQDGRYEARLPWRENHPALGDNKAVALRRLESTKKRLEAGHHYEQYNHVFQSWLEEGIIERVPSGQKGAWSHYLPHRPVIKENSTTRIRPVFDASAKQPPHPSLNDCLHTGPNLLEEVPVILLRFRAGKFGISADIEKAFLQISINPEDRDFLRFWWYDNNGQLIQLRLCRVVFGVTSSPFILNVIIEAHLRKIIESSNNNLALRKIILKLMNDMYVDNCATSVNSERELHEFMSEAKNAMESGGFNLRGWEYKGDGSHENVTSVLGIFWDKDSDTLSLNLSGFKNFDHSKITKRNILSGASRIFDPLGVICAVSLIPRLLLQDVCVKGLGWDEEVDEETGKRFLKWVDELNGLTEVRIPRCLLGDAKEENISLHTFCDASKDAYAAVTFARIECPNGVQVRFVQAKSRVAPARGKDERRHSIPRLELLAATIGLRLTLSIYEALNLQNVEIYYWSDSSTVLAWIHRENNWGTFVWNRIKEIRQFSQPAQWRHVPGHLNPADIPSRGCSVGHLLSSRWWEGPQWLKEEAHIWPNNDHGLLCNEDEILIELRKTPLKNKENDNFTITCLAMSDLNSFQKFSQYDKLIRTIAWMKRFRYNCSHNIEERKKGNLLIAEYKSAEITILKAIQNEHFDNINDDHIRHLEPFVDEDGLIRIKTRILLREDLFNFKCPIVLPQNHYIVKLIILDHHRRLNHAGTQILLSSLREKFWILGGRKSVRSVIRKCTTCLRHDGKPYVATPSPLPLDRVRDAKVFEVIGVDFAGPIYLKGDQKAWICIFTCAVYRAVHLELVNSLNIASFSMAMRRFIARRGRPSIVYSDNGTNFTGFNNSLKRLDYEKIAKIMAVQEIEWKFNPPSAAWWGGFWERLIGILKRLLRRTLKKSCLSYEEMLTTLLDCEAIINSRPITFVSEGKDEFMPLTPSHFLKEIDEIGVLDLDQIEKSDFHKKYEYRVKIKTDLRKRFRNEYLGALAHHRGNKKNKSIVNVGDIVLIGNDNSKRMDWPLGRVKTLIVGKDGNVRVVRLITASGEFVRPVQRIYPLEINNIDSNCKQNDSDKFDECVKQIVTRSGRVSNKPERLTYC